MLKPRYQMLLLSLFLLIAYYPSLSAEVNLVDDLGLVRGLSQQQGWGVRELFLPNSSGGLYYRPIQGLSFIFDKHVWQLTTGIMHLENILLHLLNTMLVYQLCRYLLCQQERSESYFPLVTSLLFGLHPIAVEPVSWLSGRADIMAGSFVLAATLFLVSAASGHRAMKLGLSFFCLVAAFLCKEASLGFLLGAIPIAAASQKNSGESSKQNVLRSACITILIIAGSAGAFFLLRSQAFVSNGSRIGLTLQHIENNPFNALLICLRSIGFYLKKIIWPFPLSFSILEVDPLYELLALPLLLLIVVVVAQRRLAIACLVTGLGLLAPAVLIAFGQIAWTPFAERYLYMPSAFIVIAISHGLWNALVTALEKTDGQYGYGIRIAEKFPPLVASSGATILVIICFWGTFHRVVVFQTNLGLYRDTSIKSPESKFARCNYGIALYMKQDYAAAEREFAVARSLYDNRYDERYDICHAVVLARMKRWKEAEATIEHVLHMTKGQSVKAYENGIDMLREQYSVVSDSSIRGKLKQKIESYSEMLAVITTDPGILYSLAKTALWIGEPRNAKIYFERALKFTGPDDYLRDITERYVKGLS